MKTAITLLALGAGLLTAGAASADDAHRRELAHRYVAAVHMAQTADAVTKAMMPSILAGLPKGDAQEQERQRAAIEVAMEVSREMVAKVAAQMEPIVADVFTEKELEDLVAFYEGPTGQSVIAKSPQIAGRLGPLMQELAPQMRRELVEKLCARIACAPEQKGAQPKPS